MPTTYAIPNGATVMAATTYTGTGSTRSVVNSGNNTTAISFQPDLVWVKSRNNANPSQLTDSVRGNTLALASDLTIAEYTGEITINSTGYSASGGAGATNMSGWTYVGWQWKAGGTSSSNTSGSITSTVSVNATAGFSVVTFTANGSAGATVGHGLGVAPAFYIIKCRSNAGTDWMVYHQSLGASAFAYLDLTNAAVTGNNSLTNGVAPSSTLITLGGSSNFNVNNYTNVIYAWAAVPGFSAFGSYTGNGSTDGTFVYLGFRPRYLLLKLTNTAGSWQVKDSSRNTYNATDLTLYPNLSNAEASDVQVDFLSNGFKLRTATGENANGNTVVYAAFAENPFKYANAR